MAMRKPREGHRPSWRALSPETLLWGALLLTLAAVTARGAWSFLGPRAASPVTLTAPPVYTTVPAFAAVERSGRRVSERDLLGKVWIANFIFTNCTATCPIQTATMARLQAQLASQQDIRFVSVTIDPERDTPEVLTRYAQRFGADPNRWLFLTGKEEALYALAREGFHLAAFPAPVQAPTPIRRAFPDDPSASGGPVGSSDAFVHDPRFALADRRLRIRGYYSSLDPEAMMHLLRDVKILLKAGD
jgi:cytochrome oxidase Cu insertion factor (SCO1/SenC/PrrC family)